MSLSEISWWCSGTLGQAWRWEYRPLLGVWLLAAVLAGAYALAVRRHAAELGGERAPSDRHYAVRFGAGLVLLVVSSDWPLGPLGAGYLASVAALRTLLLTFGVAPLLLLGTPPWMLRRLLRIRPDTDSRNQAPHRTNPELSMRNQAPHRTNPELSMRNQAPHRTTNRALRAAQIVTFPWVAFLVFNVLLVTTQLPLVVDTLKLTQLGSFALDIAWLMASIIMWVPLLRPLPELGGLGDPMRLVYLFGLSILPTVPASFLTFSRFPLYRLYELAPRVVPSLDAVVDQQIAGLGLKIGGGLILWSVMTVVFFRWAAREQPDTVPTVSWSQFERDLERYDLRHRSERPPS